MEKVAKSEVVEKSENGSGCVSAWQSNNRLHMRKTLYIHIGIDFKMFINQVPCIKYVYCFLHVEVNA